MELCFAYLPLSLHRSRVDASCTRSFVSISACKIRPFNAIRGRSSFAFESQSFHFGLQRRFGNRTSTVVVASVANSEKLAVDLKPLEESLISKDFRKADAETRRVLASVGNSAGRKYLSPDEYAKLPVEFLQEVDNLWVKYSDGRFGYSVQNKIWKEVNQTLQEYFIKTGWKFERDLAGKETPGIFRFRKWPQEFDYTLEAPTGHLPLTNHLRGKAAHLKLLNHKAWS